MIKQQLIQLIIVSYQKLLTKILQTSKKEKKEKYKKWKGIKRKWINSSKKTESNQKPSIQNNSPGQNVWNKVKKLSKTGNRQKTLIQLLTKFYFWKEDWVLGYATTQFWPFPNIS